MINPMEQQVNLMFTMIAVGHDVPLGQSIEQWDEALQCVIHDMGGLQGHPCCTLQQKKQETLGFHKIAGTHHRRFRLHDRHEVGLISLMTFIHFHCSPISCADCAYKLHGDDRRHYDQTLLVLMQAMKFWLPVLTLQMVACKWNMVMILDMIAVENGWQRSKTTVLTPGCPIPTGTVLKQSHSECRLCMILPEEVVQGTEGVPLQELDMQKGS